MNQQMNGENVFLKKQDREVVFCEEKPNIYHLRHEYASLVIGVKRNVEMVYC